MAVEQKLSKYMHESLQLPGSMTPTEIDAVEVHKSG